MDCSNSQPEIQSSSFNALTQGLKLSRKCLGVGILLLAMEAPTLAHLSHGLDGSIKNEASTEETELIEALTHPEVPSLAPEAEAAASDEIEALSDAMADVLLDSNDSLQADEPRLADEVVDDSEEVVAEADATLVDTALSDADQPNLNPESASIDSPPSNPHPLQELLIEAQASEEASVEAALEESDADIVEASASTTAKSDEAIAGETTDADDAAEPTEALAEDAAAGDDASDAVVKEEAPIPTLAERCAAPEATLFPPEPEEPEVEDAEAEDIIGESEDGEEVAIAETDPSTEEPQEPEEVAIVEPDTDLEDLDQEAKAEAAEKAAQEKELVCALYEADQQYQAGQLAEAKTTYQLAKDPFTAEAKAVGLEQKPAMTDPEELSAGGRVYLREATAGREQNLETKTLIPLELLVKQHPEFIPGQIQLSEALVAAGRADEALVLLEDASGRYPNQPDLLKAHIALAGEQEEWMDAVMVARRFAQLNPDHPQAEEFVALAEENMERFQGDVRDRLRANTIANVLTGAVSVALTGSVWNSLSSIQTTALMLRGEEGVGNGISKSIKRQMELVEDEEVVNYVQAMGEELAAVAGRDEFNYEFNILMDPNLNAFALPGGKIFVNAGAIAKTRSKAELAGLLSHEIAHAVLSHGFQLVSDGSLLSELSRFVPYGGYASNLIVLNYSRDMEREADELGARILASAGYAADGLHGLMKTLGEQDTRRPLFAWMSTHPETDERVGNLEEQISQEGLERYQFEGVEEHFRMRIKVMRLIEEWKERKEKEEEERPWWR